MHLKDLDGTVNSVGPDQTAPKGSTTYKMHLKDLDGTVNSVGPDQTAPKGAVS